jgi:peroxiredoxin
LVLWKEVYDENCWYLVRLCYLTVRATRHDWGGPVMIMFLVRVFLAGVFGISGIAKLADRGGVRRAIVEFGLPTRSAAPLGGILVCCELSVALMLLFGSLELAGSLGALALLMGFSGIVVRKLARGQSPDCHCFGRLSSGPVGWSTIARNGFFATLATFIALGGRLEWAFASLSTVAVGLWIGPMVKRRWGQQASAGAVTFELQDEAGNSWTLEALLGLRRPLVLVFSQPGCGACDALLPDIARWQKDLDGRVTIAIVSGGSRKDNLVKARKYGVQQMLADEHRSVLAAYGVTATPSAVLIDGDGTIVVAPAQGAREIEDLIGQAREKQEEPKFTRRRALGRTALRLASATFLPVLASACGSSGSNQTHSSSTPVANKNEVYVDGAWLCNQPYALCTTAECEPSKSDPNIAVCRCVVQNGYSIGFKSCTQRAQVGDKLISTFSTQNVTSSFSVMTCPSGAPWANCLDMTCQVDSTNPALALCQCQLVKTGESSTFGGGCKTNTCTSVIWSAATPDLPGQAQYKTAMKQINQPYTFPKACPSSNK